MATSNRKPQLDEVTGEYLKYAAAIRNTTPQRILTAVARRYGRLHSSLRRVQTLEAFTRQSVLDTVQEFETRHRLPKSTTYSDRPAARHQCWQNMQTNRFLVPMPA